MGARRRVRHDEWFRSGRESPGEGAAGQPPGAEHAAHPRLGQHRRPRRVAKAACLAALRPPQQLAIQALAFTARRAFQLPRLSMEWRLRVRGRQRLLPLSYP